MRISEVGETLAIVSVRSWYFCMAVYFKRISCLFLGSLHNIQEDAQLLTWSVSRTIRTL
jgi:hypothetical protein